MSERLAIKGGTPVRTRPFPPSHEFGDEDIAAAMTNLCRCGTYNAIAAAVRQAAQG